MVRNEQTKLATNIGRTKAMLNDGYSYTEIAMKLKVDESTIRSWAKMIGDVSNK